LYHRKTILSLWILSLLTLAGCFTLMNDPVPPTPVNVRLPELTIPSVPLATLPPAAVNPDNYVPMSLPDGLLDALPVMSGICFESAFDAAGRVFVMQSALDHIHFYDLADHARLCRQPVTRYPFDFTTGRVLAGLWNTGIGCTARHELLAHERDDAAKTVTLRLKFITEGDCDYELVRPFWVSIPDAQGYEVKIEVE
jgi:hypothetical protein